MESPVIPPLPEPNEVPKTEEILEQEVPVAEPAMVEWIDFVKYNGQTYEGDWSKTTVPLENIGETVKEALKTVRDEMFKKAFDNRATHTYRCTSLEEISKALEENGDGFVFAPWCGDEACEDAV